MKSAGRKRSHASAPTHAGHERPGARERGSRPSPRSSRRWLAVGAAVVSVAIAGFLLAPRWFHSPLPLPEIPSQSLSEEIARLIEQPLQEIRRNPSSSDAWGRLGGLLKSVHLTPQAAMCLTEASRLAPTDARWPYLLASLSEEPERALEHLRRAVALSGTTSETPRLRLARLLMESGRSEEATALAEELARGRTDCPPAHLMLAQLQQGRGEWNKVVDSARACAESPYTARSAASLLAMAYRRLGETNAAERAARQAATRPPDLTWPDPYEDEVLSWRSDSRSLSDRAQSHLLGGRADAAVPLIDRLVREHPDFAETWLLLGRLRYLQKQPVEAEKSLRRHLQMDPQSVNGHFQLGMTLMAQQRLADAAERFREAIRLKPDSGPAYFNLGFVLAKTGRQREAIDAFQQAVRHNPEKIDSYILLADLHVQRRETAEANRLAELAEHLDPDDARLPTLRQRIAP